MPQAIPTPNLPTPLDSQNVESGAAGIEQAGQNINEFAQNISKVGQDVYTSISRNLLTNQISNYQDTLSQAQSSILQDNSPANIAAQQGLVSNITKQSQQMADLTPEDRYLLTKTVARGSAEFNVSATRRSIDFHNTQAASSFFSTLDGNVRSIASTAALGDPDTANKMSQSLMQNAQSLVMSKAISPEQYAKVQTSINAVIGNHNQVSSSGEMTPQQQTMQSNLGLNSSFSPQPNPITAQKQGVLQNAFTLTDAKAQILASKNPVSTVSSLIQNPNVPIKYFSALGQYAQYTQAYKATSPRWNSLQSTLASDSKGPLTAQQDAEKDTANHLVSKIQNDFMGWYTQDSVEGQQATQSLNDNLKGIEQSLVLSPQSKMQQMQDLQKQYDVGVISHAKAVGIPDKYVSLLDPNSPQATLLKSGFTAGNNPIEAINYAKSTKSFLPYYLNQLPASQQAMYAAAAISPASDPSLLVLGSQAGLKIDKIYDSEGKEVPDSKIKMSLLSNSNVRDYLSMTNKGMYDSTLNGFVKAAKYACVGASCDADTAAAHVAGLLPNDYVEADTGDDNYPSAKTTFLNSQLPMKLSSYDASVVGSYVKNQTYQSLIHAYSLTNSATATDNYARNLKGGFYPLQITNDPAGNIMAVSANSGTSVFKMPLTETLLQSAHSYARTNSAIINPIRFTLAAQGVMLPVSEDQ